LTLNWIYFLCGGDSAFADDLDRYLELSIKSRKQTTVTTSTTEAELLAPSRAAQETYWWWKRLFNAVDFELDNDIHISCDNKPTVDSIRKEDIELKTKMKHVDIYNH
jgi:hypothetical protein